MKCILVVEDDIPVGDMLEELLCREGYHVRRAYSGSEALLVLQSGRPDLVLLDLMLPGLAGEEVLAQIRDIPVIVVSAKLDVDNKVQLLLGGAADYITKPFDPKELLARIVVALRRAAGTGKGRLSAGALEMDTEGHSVTAAGRPVRLTRTEYAVLRQLLERPGQVITKGQLLDRISEDTPDCTESSLKIHVSNLRKKLREAGGQDFVEAVWGIGFTLKAD